jgi:hypothetical protein
LPSPQSPYSPNSPGGEKVTFHPFAEGAALHREGGHRLWVLNASSAVIWCLREECGEGDGLVSAYADHFGIPVKQARKDVNSALAEFALTGLTSGSSALPHVADPAFPPTRQHPRVSAPESPVLFHNSPPAWQQSYRTAGVCWRISCADAAAARDWFGCFAHLVTEETAPDLHYGLTQNPVGWTLRGPGETVRDLADNEVLPWVLTLLFGELCARQPQHLLIHAAAAVRDGRMILLPGESTSGKSTFAAELAALGWTLFSDELAPVDPATLQVVPFPLPVGIKSRSVAALQNFYPALAAQSVFRRADGQIVRYLGPSQLPLADPAADPVPIAILVFPRYRPGMPARLDRMTPLEALERLARTGSSQRPLCSDDVEALLTLAGQRACWSLEYGNLEEAVKVLFEI